MHILMCFFIKSPPEERLNDWLEYLYLNGMTKSPLCQEKSAIRNLRARAKITGTFPSYRCWGGERAL
jgi:hypothetical protein